MEPKMHILKFFIALLIAGFLLTTPCTGAAGDVYRWVDEDGMVHYGDRPPEQPGVETVKINKDPSADAPGSAESPYTTDESGKKEPSFAEQQRKQREVNRKDARIARAELDEACAQRRKVVAELEPARRVLYKSDDGEVVRMDDNVRLGYLAEANKYLADNCKD